MSTRKIRVIRIIILVIGLPLAYWVYPAGLLNTSPDSLTLGQFLQGSASLVIFFWTITFAVNVSE